MLQKHCYSYLMQDNFFKKELTHSLKQCLSAKCLIFSRVALVDTNGEASSPKAISKVQCS